MGNITTICKGGVNRVTCVFISSSGVLRIGHRCLRRSCCASVVAFSCARSRAVSKSLFVDLSAIEDGTRRVNIACRRRLGHIVVRNILRLYNVSSGKPKRHRVVRATRGRTLTVQSSFMG